MHAARIDRFGGPDVLRVEDVPPPALGPGQVLIDVVGSSVNPVDIAVRSGWMAEYLPLLPPMTLGTDVAGVVSRVGEGVTGLAPGDPVYGVAGVVMGGSGGFAEQAVTAAAMLATPPAGIDLTVAGTLPLAGIAALEAVTERLNVESGADVLVHGASGGVGLVAVALAKHLGGRVVATVHRDGASALDAYGADDVVDTDATELSSLRPFDLTLDLVGLDPVLPVQVTKPGGRVVGLRTPPDQQVAAERGVEAVLQGTQVSTQRLDRLRDYVERGIVVPRVSHVFDLADVGHAVATKEAGGVYGKIAVKVR